MNEIALCYLSLPSEVNMYLEGDKKKSLCGHELVKCIAEECCSARKACFYNCSHCAIGRHHCLRANVA